MSRLVRNLLMSAVVVVVAWRIWVTRSLWEAASWFVMPRNISGPVPEIVVPNLPGGGAKVHVRMAL